MAIGDIHFDKVSLLLSFETASDNATDTADPPSAFVDSSAYGAEPYYSNSTRLRKDARGLNGNVMEVWNWSSPVGLRFYAADQFNFGTGDFTIEFRALITGGNSTSDYPNILACPEFAVRKLDVGGGYQFRVGASQWLTTDASNISATELTPIMVSRASGVYRMFINGVLSSTYSGSTGSSLEATSMLVFGGGGYGTLIEASSRYFGFYDQLRITKGVARATASYTPSTTPFPTYAAQFLGNVKDATGANASRLIRAFREDTGAPVGAAVSDPVTGNYTLNSAYAGACTLVFYPAPEEGSLNALVLRGVTPV